MASLLEIDSVIKSYDFKHVLTDIHLKCKTGNIIGLLGRNGSGKSTLLKILFGTLQADCKFIRIDGKVYDSPYKAKNVVNYLPQDAFLPRHMKVEKVVELFLGKSLLETFLNDRVLCQLRKSVISNLSGGELRYLEIKLLLNSDSKFVLLDEPFNGVSPILVDEIKKAMVEVSKFKGLILTDHDYRNVLDVANRYCLIFDGGIKQIDDKQELVKWGYVTELKI